MIGAAGVVLGLLAAALSLTLLSGDDDLTATVASSTTHSTTAPADVKPMAAGEAATTATPATSGSAADAASSAPAEAMTATPAASSTPASASSPIDGDATTTSTAATATADSSTAPAGFTSGIATYYDATGGGACMFDPSPGDLRVAALNAPQFGAADLCGAWVEVVGPQGSVTVRIVDLCPECATGHLDLSAEAFAAIGNPVDGIIGIEWRLVDAEVAGPISFRFKEGSSQYWTAVQVRNHRHPVATLEYQLADGSWRAVARTQYNYFVEEAGMGPGPYTFRVTDAEGNVVVEPGISLAVAQVVPGSSQFP